MFKSIGNIIKFLWKSVNFIRNLLVNLFFIFFLLIFAIVIISTINNIDQTPVQPDSAALLLNLDGKIVEQKSPIRLIDQLNKNLSNGDQAGEIELQELIHVIDTATDDIAITALVLDLGQLQAAHLSKLEQIGDAILRFKNSKKPVIAIGDYYSQEQYFLASFADTVYLNPAGGVLVTGYGRYQLYLKKVIEKLMITAHVFRVGSHKSAVEPFIREDMSPEARSDAQRWLNKLWDKYVSTVSSLRNIDKDQIAPSIAQFQQRFKAVNGNQARYAQQVGLVDELKTRPEQLAILQKVAGSSDKGRSYSHISYYNYQKIVGSPYKNQQSSNKIALITASGTIMNGKQPTGSIGGDTLAAQINEARLNKDIKALVLRIDSPGGSAFAAEIIRNELQSFKAAGKPFVVSMGSAAASGGYWIAADADKIFASGTTITGSIGIFGMFPTFEKTLSSLGINTDGVSTGPFAGIGITQALPDHVAQAIQLGINNGYQQFIQLVANGRNMTLEQVDSIAQGRIWTGSEALTIGLVDEIGDLSSAVNAAAELAQLTDYNVLPIKERLTAKEQLLMDLFGASLNIKFDEHNPLRKLAALFQHQINTLEEFNDPQGRYAHCTLCQ